MDWLESDLEVSPVGSGSSIEGVPGLVSMGDYPVAVTIYHIGYNRVYV